MGAQGGPWGTKGDGPPFTPVSAERVVDKILDKVGGEGPPFVRGVKNGGYQGALFTLFPPQSSRKKWVQT